MNAQQAARTYVLVEDHVLVPYNSSLRCNPKTPTIVSYPPRDQPLYRDRRRGNRHWVNLTLSGLHAVPFFWGGKHLGL